MIPFRAILNQPSVDQPFHKYHMQVGIVTDLYISTSNNQIATIYYTEGDTISMRVPSYLLTKLK